MTVVNDYYLCGMQYMNICVKWLQTCNILTQKIASWKKKMYLWGDVNGTNVMFGGSLCDYSSNILHS